MTDLTLQEYKELSPDLLEKTIKKEAGIILKRSSEPVGLQYLIPSIRQKTVSQFRRIPHPLVMRLCLRVKTLLCVKK